MNANELVDGIPPALWANPKTEIHGIVDVRTYPLEGFIPLCLKQDADAMLRQQQAEIEALKNQLGFIASINRAGLGVVSGTPMPSEKVEKIWNSIEEQKDDNFHYGWKKCEQYYGFSHLAKTLTDEEVIRIVKRFVGTEPLVHEIEQAILRKAQEK